MSETAAPIRSDSLTDEERELFADLAEAYGDEPIAELFEHLAQSDNDGKEEAKS